MINDNKPLKCFSDQPIAVGIKLLQNSNNIGFEYQVFVNLTTVRPVDNIFTEKYKLNNRNNG